MSKTLQIEIIDKCNTLEPHPHMDSQTGYTHVQWKCRTGKSYTLHLPGGVFVRHSADFHLQVNDSDWVPDHALERIPNITCKIVNYIYDSSGNNCVTLADPPDILINP